jgi:predicted Zn-dependent protease
MPSLYQRHRTSTTAARGCRSIFVVAVAFVFLGVLTARAQDASIERLLKKLPPPETLVTRPPAIPADQLEVLNDPLTTRIGTTCAYGNWMAARWYAERLAQAHPNNPWVHCIRGQVAVQATRFSEAAAAFNRALKVRPKFSYAHLQLGSVEVVQQHFAAAIPYFKKYVELEPNEPIGWVFLSGCNEKLGRGKECLEYAKRGIATGPQYPGTWLQLAHAENAVGHPDNAKRALAKAEQLMRSR